MRRFLITGALMTAVALAAVTGATAAVPSPSYQLGGVALGTSFFGTGQGSTGDRASWQATLPSAGGGTLTLRSTGQQLTGTLSDVQTAVATAAPGCGRQTVSLNATVTTADGPMTLTGTVTRFRLQLGRTCFTLLSTVQATLAAATPPPPPPSDGDGQL